MASRRALFSLLALTWTLGVIFGVFWQSSFFGTRHHLATRLVAAGGAGVDGGGPGASHCQPGERNTETGCVPASIAAPPYSHASWYTCTSPTDSTWQTRTCLLRNVCLHLPSGYLLFFDPSGVMTFDEPLVRTRAYHDEFVWRPALVRNVSAPRHLLSTPEAHRSVLLMLHAFWPENFGHALFDDVGIAYRMLRRVGLHPDLVDVHAFLGEPGCAMDEMGDSSVVMRACRNHERMWPGLLDRPPRIIPMLAGRPVSDAEAQAMLSNTSALQCASRAVVGVGRDLTLRYADESHTELSDRMLRRLGGPALVSLYHAGFTEHRIAVMRKGGRRDLANVDEVVAHIRRETNLPTDELPYAALGELPLEEQMRAMMQYTVVVTPGGGGSCITLFMRPGSAALYYTFFDIQLNRTGVLEEGLWRRDYRHFRTTVPLQREDIEFLPDDLDRFARGEYAPYAFWRDRGRPRARLPELMALVWWSLAQVCAAHEPTLGGQCAGIYERAAATATLAAQLRNAT